MNVSELKNGVQQDHQNSAKFEKCGKDNAAELELDDKVDLFFRILADVLVGYFLSEKSEKT